MIATVLAVLGTILGTLAGAGLTGLLQHKTAVRTALTARTTELRREQLDAVTTLASRVSSHRIAMFRRGDARLKLKPEDVIEELRAISHDTRREITDPLVRVRILIQDPTVRAAADAMVDTTFNMRNSDGTTDRDLTREGLTAARLAAVTAHDQFVDVVARYFSE